jgi:hypothetical protein
MRLFVAAFSLATAALALIPIQFPVNTAGETSILSLDIANSSTGDYRGLSTNTEHWSFDEGPPENTTWNLVFDTVHSFLQHWPNTRYRNGTFRL